MQFCCGWLFTGVRLKKYNCRSRLLLIPPPFVKQLEFTKGMLASRGKPWL